MTLHPTFQGICEAHGAPQPEPFRVWQSDQWTILHVTDGGGGQATISLTARDARALAYQLRQANRATPIVPSWNGVGKYTIPISLDCGTLGVYCGGHGNAEGCGYFVAQDDELEFEQEDGPVYRWINVSNSDLLHLRDQLNELFPLDALAAAARKGRDVQQARGETPQSGAESVTPKGHLP